MGAKCRNIGTHKKKMGAGVKLNPINRGNTDQSY